MKNSIKKYILKKYSLKHAFMNIYNINRKTINIKNTDDTQTLYSDWKCVGEDIKTSISTYDDYFNKTQIKIK